MRDGAIACLLAFGCDSRGPGGGEAESEAEAEAEAEGECENECHDEAEARCFRCEVVEAGITPAQEVCVPDTCSFTGCGVDGGAAGAICSQESDCSAGLDCVFFSGLCFVIEDELGVCSPPCDDLTACPLGGVCALDADADQTADHCLWPCAGTAECPACCAGS